MADTLDLPIFDDFSDTRVMPDQAMWSDISVFINNNYGIDPVSNGVATLDAIDFDGSIYPGASTRPFEADRLTSRPIRLSYSVSDSIYLSFLYQAKGLGDEPEEGDSLMVDFFDPVSSSWTNVWRIPGTGDNQVRPFRHVMIPVTGSNYLVDGFRFRFRNLASLPGVPAYPEWDSNVDHWHVDYVRLDRQRFAADTVLRDVAFSTSISSVLKDLTAVPWDHFEDAYNTLLEPNVFVRYRNNDTIPRNLTRSLTFGEPYYNESDMPFSPTAQDLPGLEDTVVVFDYFYSLDFDRGDSALIRFTASLRTDEFDPKMNDTVVYDQLFKDYYAYDDGTPEAGYGLNGQGTKNGVVAMKYKAYKPDLLGGVEVLFNQQNDSANLGYYFKLMVWNDNDGEPGSVIWEDENDHVPAYSNSFPGFTRYYFTEPVPVDGDFYVGWRQYNQFLLNVGYDLNNRPRPDHVMFYNFEGSWSMSDKPGVMMFRPFIYNPATESKPAEASRESILVYPNPASSHVHIRLPYKAHTGVLSVGLYDSSGRLTDHITCHDGTVDISSHPAGIYYMKIRSGERVYHSKVLITR